MPLQQVATVPVYDVSPGSPGLQFVAKRGGNDLTARIEAQGEAVTVTGQVSADSVTWAAMTTAGNGDAMAAVVVNPGGHVTKPFHLRQGLDKYLRFNVSGGRCLIQLAGSENLEVQKL